MATKTRNRVARYAGGTLALFMAVATVATAHAQAPADDAPPYLDDRSTAESVVRSLYNALNRAEYARAYSYFGEDAEPPDFETFVDGYENTATIELLLGELETEGAAGSIYSSVPTVITATDKSGGTETFAGCYVLRLAQPAIQAPPFEPIHIIRGSLDPVDAEPADALAAVECEE